MNAPVKPPFSKRTLIIAFMLLIMVAFRFSAPLLSGLNAQALQAEIVGIEPFTGTFSAGQDIDIEFGVRDRRSASSGGGGFTYTASIVVEDAERNIVFDSREEGMDRKFTLFPGESRTVEFRWDVPSNAERGEFSVLGSLYNEDLTELFDIWEPGDAEEGDPDLTVAPGMINFGEINAGETTMRSLTVLNEGTGILEWKVIEWPEDWLTLLEPQPEQTVRGQGRIRVEVRDDIGFGISTGRIRVESNGGNQTIPVEVFVKGNPDGEVTRININGGSRFVQGDVLNVDVQIENTGDVSLDYRVTFIVENSGREVYNSNESGEDKRVHVDDGDELVIKIFWNIPTFANSGEYTVMVELRAWNDFGCKIYPILDCGEFQEPSPPTGVIVNDTFEITRNPPRTLVEPSSYGFGSIQLGETSEAKFTVTNSGRGVMSWEVGSLPEWLDLIRPTSQVVGGGQIVVRVSESAPGGRLSGEIEVVSTGENRVIPVSVSINAPTPTRTPSPVPTLSPTPAPSATPTPAPPTATREPVALPASVFFGEIVVRDGLIPDNARLVARIDSYESPPAFISGTNYSNLVVAPVGEEFFGLPVEFYLEGVKASNPVRPIFYLPNMSRPVDLIFDASGALQPTATPVPPTSTPTPVTPTITPTATLTSTLIPTATASPTITPTPTLDIVVQVITSTPFDPVPGEDSENGPGASSGSCGAATGPVSAWTGAANVLFIIAPLGMIAAYRRLHHRGLR